MERDISIVSGAARGSGTRPQWYVCELFGAWRLEPRPWHRPSAVAFGPFTHPQAHRVQRALASRFTTPQLDGR